MEAAWMSETLGILPQHNTTQHGVTTKKNSTSNMTSVKASKLAYLVKILENCGNSVMISQYWWDRNVTHLLSLLLPFR
jgi:hypothetical protein